jgi:hypothetical protein
METLNFCSESVNRLNIQSFIESTPYPLATEALRRDTATVDRRDIHK